MKLAMEANIPALASWVAAIVTPFLPILTKSLSSAFNEAVDEVGKQTGGAVFGFAKKLWGTIFPKISDEQTKEALFKEPPAESASELEKMAFLDSNKSKIRSLVEEIGKDDARFIDALKALYEAAEKESAATPLSDVAGIRIGSQVAKTINNFNGSFKDLTINQS